MTSMLSPVSFTQNAIDEIRNILNNSRPEDQGKSLRVGVKGGGCSGLSYVLNLDDRHEKDQPFEVDGIHFVMNPAHAIYLFGMEIDWQDGLNSRGFVFHNPNASKTCGCGTSFSV